jgi:hypothetical protein
MILDNTTFHGQCIEKTSRIAFRGLDRLVGSMDTLANSPYGWNSDWKIRRFCDAIEWRLRQ